MEENIYSKLPKLKIELSLTTLVVSVLVIIFGFIIPVSLFQNSTQPQNVPSSGQVAGATTSKEEEIITLPIINQSVVLEGQSGVLILMGLLLLGFCILITIYLITDSVIKRQK